VCPRVCSGRIFQCFNQDIVNCRRGGKIEGAMVAGGGAKYVQMSSGPDVSFFLRNDGMIDAVKSGKVVRTDSPLGAGAEVKYVAISSQLTQSTDDSSWPVDAHYFLRSDGLADRYSGWGTKSPHSTFSAGHNVQYISASSGPASYVSRFFRSVATAAQLCLLQHTVLQWALTQCNRRILS
jgi:hypothetical protein